MKAYFGKSFTYTLYPLSADGARYENLLPTVQWYLFDAKPSRTDAIAGTEVSAQILAEGDSWEDTKDSKGKKFTIPVVDDPDPDSDEFTKIYYIAINAQLANNEIFTIIKPIEFSRPFTHDSIIEITPLELCASEPSIRKFCTCLGDLEDYIDAALSDLRTLVDGCEYDFRHLSNPADLKLAVIKLAISKFWEGQSRNPNDIYIVRAMKAKDESDKLLKRVMLRFDKNQDGTLETKSRFGIRSIRILR